MKRNPKVFLYDIIEAADAVTMAVAGLTLEDDKASRLSRSGPVCRWGDRWIPAWPEEAVRWIAFAVKAFGTDFRTNGCGIRALDSPERAHIRP